LDIDGAGLVLAAMQSTGAAERMKTCCKLTTVVAWDTNSQESLSIVLKSNSFSYLANKIALNIA